MSINFFIGRGSGYEQVFEGFRFGRKFGKQWDKVIKRGSSDCSKA
jgi:hypothetical protein